MTETNLQAEMPAEAAFPVEQDAAPATATEAPDSAPDDAGTPETSEEKPKGGFQRRIGELTRNWREAERRNEELMEVLQRLAPKQYTPEEPKAAPTLEQHGYNENEYQKALVEYAKAEARREVQETLKREREEATKQTRAESFRSRESEFADSVEDYYDVVYSPTTPISQTMAEVIAESEHGAALAYHLGKNPQIARALYSLPPIQAARELGRLEAKLAEPKPKPVVTKAPPPPPKIEASEPEAERDPDKMSVDEWLKWRNKQLRRGSR